MVIRLIFIATFLFMTGVLISKSLSHSWYYSYRNPVTSEYCCLSTHCRPVGSDRVILEGEYYRWVDAPIPERGTLPLSQVLRSHDSEFHVCWRENEVKCIFEPVVGM